MNRSRSRASLLVCTAALAGLLPLPALAATPAHKCEAGKNGAAGKLTACLHTAQLKFLNGGALNSTARDRAIAACGETFTDKWQALEDKAGDAVCPSQDDAAQVREYLGACVDGVEAALHGGMLPLDIDACETAVTNCGEDLSGCAELLSDTEDARMDCTADLADIDAGTATAGNVLAGKTFASMAGRETAGTMPSNGAVLLIPGTADQAIAAGHHNGSGKCAGDPDLVAGKIKSGISVFGIAGTLVRGALGKTGQTDCYDTAGNQIACAGTGQDGAVRAGVPSQFTDNGDATITDNVTGLMWEKHGLNGGIHDKDDLYLRAEAISIKIASLNSSYFAGHNDWRLPNRNELLTLVNLGTAEPAAFEAFNLACDAGCSELSVCSCTEDDGYWTSNTREDRPDDGWFVDFFDGAALSRNKEDTSLRVRAVRGGS